MAWERRQLQLSQEGRGASGLLCRGHTGQQWCPTGSLWGGTVPGKWHCPACLGTHNLLLIPSCIMGQGHRAAVQGSHGAHPGRAGAGLALEHWGQALQVWTDAVCVSAHALLVLPTLAYSQSHLLRQWQSQ